MPNFTSITINDGQTTPVGHVFAPLNKDGTTAYFVDRSPVNSVGWKTIKHEVVPAKSPKAANRTLIRITDPVLGTVDGQTVKMRSASVDMAFNFPVDATEQEKKDCIAYAINWLSNASVKLSIQNQETFYS